MKIIAIATVMALVLSVFPSDMFVSASASTETGYVGITAEEAMQIINSYQSVVLLDIRPHSEYKSGHIRGAISLPFSAFVRGSSELAQDQTIIVYSANVNDSTKACQILVQKGFKDVYLLLGGIDAWMKVGLPTTASSAGLTRSLPGQNSSPSSSMKALSTDIPSLSSSAPGYCPSYGGSRLYESIQSGETFVTRKITRALARIKLGLQDCLSLGNLDAKRDSGHARDYVEAQWLMLQQPGPDDFVIATGRQYSVRDFVNAAAKQIGMELAWKGKGAQEHAVDGQGNCVVRVDPRYFRPTEVEALLGDPTKAREKLGWKAKVTFPELVSEMMLADLAEAERDELVKRHGFLAPDRRE